MVVQNAVMAKLKVALAQINPVLGDIAANERQILGVIKSAQKMNCDLVVFPELALLGYPPMDLLERPKISQDCRSALQRMLRKIPRGIAALVGTVDTVESQFLRSGSRGFANKRLYNSVALIQRDQPIRYFNKTRLPQYDVFDEARHFRSGFHPLETRSPVRTALARHFLSNRFSLKGFKIQVTVCEDIWGWGLPDHELSYAPTTGKSSVDLVVNCSASPFSTTKVSQRESILSKTASHFRAPVVYVNAVGAQDEIIFDGASAVISRPNSEKKSFYYAFRPFEERLGCAEFFKERQSNRTAVSEVADWSIDMSSHYLLDAARSLQQSRQKGASDKAESLRSALVMGLRDFCSKTGLDSVVLGMSGGVDSAVVAALAVEALGANRVLGVAMPGPFSSSISLTLAKEQAQSMGIQLREWAISKHYELVLSSLQSLMGSVEFGVTHENLQARLRAVVLMLFANLENRLLLSTSNKSELATGYSTLYGDQCGGLAPLGDCLKGEVFALARLFNEKGWIPSEVLLRAPTAELRENQKDEDTLPKYEILEQSVSQIVEHCGEIKNSTDRFLLSALYRNEFKRWQAPPILRVSDHAFGRGRRFPIAHKYRK